ncbi:DUF6452 family protein [Flavobacterium sp. NRK F10]|uniref:DUF6452 family protein n=1 Tax=Flavobacterium sp. NRK F10 TaxID=2954931 RepID=UPI0020903437|nr:DUF6452 family protein [Flavobacterium sp. NRK F10]MCO6175731.1 DUF6452 family protein [Flavobacterium sp. NRK F10]
MKKYSIISLMILFAVSFWNCEKDDLCADGTVTTPQLVIEFYDATNTTEIKEVTGIAYFETSVNDTLSESSVTQILLPLKTNADQVTFKLILNGNDEDTSDDIEDILTIDYTREDIYISRACGYKTNFNLTGVTLNSTNWISNYTIEQSSITNEDEVHLKLYF